MKRIGIFVDLNNLYHTVSKKYEGRKLSYASYLNYIKDFGAIMRQIAYGMQNDSESRGFFYHLEQLGFLLKVKPPQLFTISGQVIKKVDFKVEMTLDVIEMLNELDTVFLGTSDSELAPLADYLHRKGIKVIVLATDISNALKYAADVHIEIPESLLEARKVESNEVSIDKDLC